MVYDRRAALGSQYRVSKAIREHKLRVQGYNGSYRQVRLVPTCRSGPIPKFKVDPLVDFPIT